MTVAAMIEQLERMPRTHKLTVCDRDGRDDEILAITDGGEEECVIIDLGTQDDIEVSQEWPLGWHRVEV